MEEIKCADCGKVIPEKRYKSHGIEWAKKLKFFCNRECWANTKKKQREATEYKKYLEMKKKYEAEGRA